LNSVISNTLGSGLKCIIVPVLLLLPTSPNSDTGSPLVNSCIYSLSFLLTFTFNHSDRAFTTETPTPCNPPDTLYAALLNFPPACNTVSTVSTVDLPVCG